MRVPSQAAGKPRAASRSASRALGSRGCSAKAVNVHEDMDDEITFSGFDVESINHVELIGCMLLKALVASLHSRDQRCMAANVKVPALRCVHKASLNHKIKH